MASVRVVDPVAVVQAPDLTITEFFGNVASGTFDTKEEAAS